MSKRDYYAVLELNRTCTLHEVRQSFKKLALRWHPDKCLNKIEAELRFNEIHEAYSILNDERKKRIYDEYGHDGLKTEEEATNNVSVHTFFQKGFQGTEKSAFDVLKGIFEENDDDCFFQNFNSFGISDSFQSNVKSFIEENVFCNKSEPEPSFFDTYQPTFMNPNFFMSPPEFPTFGFEAQSTTQVFSFLSTNMGNNSYASTSSMMFQEKRTSSSSDIFENLSSLFESKVTCTPKDNKNSDSTFTPKQKNDGQYLVIEDECESSPDGNTTKDTEFFSFGEFDAEFSSESDSQQKISSPSKKITKAKEGLNIRYANKKPSKKGRVSLS